MGFRKGTDKEIYLLNRLTYKNLDKYKGMTFAQIKEDLEKNSDSSDLSKICDELIKYGYDNVIIKDVLNNNDKGSKSGYYGIALADENNNCAILSRGTDFNFKNLSSDDIMQNIKSIGYELITSEDMYDNVQALYVGDSIQTQEARDFFEKNKSETGKNYLYGHSKGGSISTEIYLDNYEEIEEVNIINAPPPNNTLLSEEDKAKLADSKLKPIIHADDLVSYLGTSYGSLNTGTRYVETKANDYDPFTPHLISSAIFEGDNLKDTILSPYQYHLGPVISNTILDSQKQYNIDQTIFDLDFSFLKDFSAPSEEEKESVNELITNMSNIVKKSILDFTNSISTISNGAKKNLPLNEDPTLEADASLAAWNTLSDTNNSEYAIDNKEFEDRTI